MPELTGNSMSNFARQTFVWFMSLGSFMLFPRRRRYLIAFPPISSRNYIYRRASEGKTSTLDKVELRSSFDFDTALQVFGGQDYDLSLIGLDANIEAEVASAKADGLIPLIVDVGANIGLSVLFFAREYPSTHILAIEPSPENCDLISRNTGNIDPTRIKIVQAALASGNSPGEIFLDISSGNNAFRTFRASSNSGGTKQISVPAMGLSGVMTNIEDGNYKPLILKVDVEGAESEIFRDESGEANIFSLIILEPHDWLLGKPVASSFLAFHSKFARLFKMRNENIFSLRVVFEEPK